MDKGLVHIYCGDGKGKTTAAIGLTVRAAGAGFRVMFVQFLKGGQTGELDMLRAMNGVTVMRLEKAFGFTWTLNDKQQNELRAAHDRLFAQAVQQCGDGKQTLLVMDELVGAMDLGLIDRGHVIDFIRNKPEELEVVMTGRNPDEELTELADYISEVRAVRHPMDKGITARKGIEF